MQNGYEFRIAQTEEKIAAANKLREGAFFEDEARLYHGSVGPNRKPVISPVKIDKPNFNRLEHIKLFVNGQLNTRNQAARNAVMQLGLHSGDDFFIFHNPSRGGLTTNTNDIISQVFIFLLQKIYI